MSRVLFAGGGTGGHLYPAMALAEAMQRLRPELEVHFVGANRGVEASVLPAAGVPHTLLPIEPIRRDRVWRNWRLLPSAIGVARGLSSLFKSFRPELVVGTGGYASGPAGAWAVLRGVPLALQEQNSYPGLTTRWLSRRAQRVYLGFPEAAEHLRPGRGTEVAALGNPIRPPDPSLDRGACRREFGLEEDGVVALIVGGSQGSLALNEAVLGALERVAGRAAVGEGAASTSPRVGVGGDERGTRERSGEAAAAWPAGLQLLWATGPTHLETVQARLSTLELGDRVRAVGYIETMPRALAASDIAVSRAGAMATAELLAWSIPAILVPLPTAAADHQAQNAKALAETGAALCIAERELSPERLWRELCTLATDPERRAAMAERARERSNPEAADRIARGMLVLMEVA